MKLACVAGAALAVWYVWLRPRSRVFTDSRQVDPFRFLPWPRQGIDPGAIVARAPYNIDPGR